MSQAQDEIKFGTDGIRQTAGDWPLSVQGLHRIGLGIGRYLSEKTNRPSVVIGRDTRISGDYILSALCSGLLSYKIDVVDVGIITTAGIAYLTKHYQQDIGIVISASHNPWTENGIKLVGPDGFKLSDEIEQVLEDAINSRKLDSKPNGFGRVTTKPEWIDVYIEHLVAPFEQYPFEKLRVVLDCSNGAASWIAPRCFAKLGSDITVLHNSPDGTNINRNSGSEIVRERRGDLIPMVLKKGAHFGVAFDGDADRAVFVDETGGLIDGDHILYIFARHLHEINRLPGQTVVTTKMANSGLDIALAQSGIKVIRTNVGDKYVTRELYDSGYSLGGEQSGHIILFDKEHTTGDGIFTALSLSQILLEGGNRSLKDMAADLVKLPQVIASAYVSKKPRVEDIDDFIAEQNRIIACLGENGTLNIRYSGTEPLFRVMIQGANGHSFDGITGDAVKLCRILQENTGDTKGHIEVKNCATGAPVDVSQYE